MSFKNDKWHGLSGIHRVMDSLNPESEEYDAALQALSDPESQQCKEFCQRHKLAPVTRKLQVREDKVIDYYR